VRDRFRDHIARAAQAPAALRTMAITATFKSMCLLAFCMAAINGSM
jgi:hypothetical protein